MKEYAVLLGEKRALVGIVTDSETLDLKRKYKIGTVLLNAGLIHHVGPNRLYVKLARMLSVLGLASLRFDMSGIGDSRQRTDNLSQESAVILEVGEAMDYLQRGMGVDRIVLISTCASSPVAFLIAEADPRIIGCILINPLAPRTDQTDLIQAANYYWKVALFNRSSWLKLLRLRIDFKTVLRSIHHRGMRKIFPRYVEKSEAVEIVERLNGIFEIFRDRNVKLLVVSSQNDMGVQFIKEVLGKQYSEMERQGVIETRWLTKTDHNITPIGSQNQLIAYIMDWMKKITG